MDIETLSKDGFFLNETNSVYSNIAFLSLRSSLISFFQTSTNLNELLSNSKLDKLSQTEINKEHGIKYAGNACDAISHFHHFTELILKDILRSANTLLAVDASDNPTLLHKLANKESISDSEIESLRQIEFKTALDRVVVLTKASILDNSYDFIVKSKQWLEKINSLRNRISHRGAFVLRYNALNELFGKYILPFVIKVTSLPQYNSIMMWKLNMCNDDIHPIEDIINEYTKKNIDQYKIQLLKLLANSSYNNPIYSTYSNMFSFINKDKIDNAELIAEQYAKKEWYYSKHICPVCGIKALVPEFDSYEEFYDEGKIINCEDYVYQVKCHCCSFELERYIIHRLSTLGVQIEDYSKLTR